MPKFIVHLFPICRVEIPIEAHTKDQAVKQAVDGFLATQERSPYVVGAIFADEFHDPAVVDIDGALDYSETTEQQHFSGAEFIS